ncbi:hypothetical protein KIH77_04200 [Bifidobacterium sp. 82T24]|uniref:hypothetical protein n=1 Tax=Bifidobacterium pluvialisilvae TaxID=2834436 RepID=UPI001C57ADDB|nr:hypothetical protein [Bifidobacterium pluvialisilvae]MBW3087935.1 hypothetical protein [Bifidobacterium pluvialisilvae]
MDNDDDSNNDDSSNADSEASWLSGVIAFRMVGISDIGRVEGFFMSLDTLSGGNSSRTFKQGRDQPWI